MCTAFEDDFLFKVSIASAEKEERKTDISWLRSGCSTLGELDKGSGVLHVWYLLLDGLATAISSCPRSFQPQTLTTLFQLLRDTANVPGEGQVLCVMLSTLLPVAHLHHTLSADEGMLPMCLVRRQVVWCGMWCCVHAPSTCKPSSCSFSCRGDTAHMFVEGASVVSALLLASNPCHALSAAEGHYPYAW